MEANRTRPVELAYSPRPPRHRKFARRAIQAMFFAVVVGVLVISVPWAWRSVRIAYWLHRCSAYSRPPGSIAFETDPTRVRALLGSDPQYRPNEDGDPSPGRAVASWQPAELVALGNLIDTPNLKLGVPFWEFPPVAFLGELKSRSGVHRLVLMCFEGYVSYFDHNAYKFKVTIFHPGWPGSIRGHPTYEVEIQDDGRSIGHGNDPEIRQLCFGTRDPADPSKFGIAYETDSGRGSIYFGLSDDGEAVAEVAGR